MHSSKKYIAVVPAAFLLSASFLQAQVTTTRNHVVNNTVIQPGITTQAQVDALPVSYRAQSVAYFDGLGRPLQTVLTQANPAQKDIINPVEYDNYGREIKKFLPYADLTGTVYGSLRSSAYADQSTFYNPSTTTNSIAKDVNPYTQIFMEFSPVSRPLESGAPGQTWQPGSGHTIKPLSLLNTATDDVKRWTVSYVANNWGSYTMAGTYTINDLYKTIAADEHGKQVIEFKDREGKILLKKVQLTAANDNGSGSGYTGWMCTYYIYDDFNNLRCVIQPEGVKILSSGSWILTSSLLDEQCFRYEYDARNRMIRKKVPGAGEVYMVYDGRNRLVMTQDANLRTANKWMATIYDIQNRPLMTGLILNTWSGNKTFSAHLTDAYNSTTYPFTYTTQPSATYWEPLTETHYDDYNNIPGGLNNSFVSTYVTSANFITTYNTSPYYAQQMTASLQTKGLVTWAQVKVLGTTTWLASVTIYDEDGRVIQLKNQNISGGTDMVTNQYDFGGKLLRSHLAQQKSGTNADVYQVLTKMEYDHAGRVTAVKKTVSSNSITGTEKTIAQNTYDELGQVKTKKLAAEYNSGAGIETLTFDYNIRGWMLGINRDYLINQGQSGANRFGFELNYDKATTKSGRSITAPLQYNGNIAGITWKSDGDDVRRKYDFSYDAANRLLQGAFEQEDGTNSWNNTTMNYKVQMGNGTDPTTAYDANGNIKAMTQYGWKIGAPAGIIDNLTYNYMTGSNKLLNVIDASNDAQTKLGDFRTSTLHPNQTKNSTTVDYTYDANGNLKKDLNKDIGTASAEDIVYNHLNLPQTITVRTTGGAVKGTITYTYDAAGTKLQKTVTETGQPLKTTLYIGGAVYENDVLQFISHEEGRVRLAPLPSGGSGWVYDYFIKDHLGNVRMVLTDEIKSDPYPMLTFENDDPATPSVNELTEQNNLWENASGTSIDVVNVRTAGVSGFNSATGNGSYVRSIKKSTGAIGAAKLLKVMAGDRIHTKVDYFYTAANADNGGANPLNSFVNSLTSAFGTTSQVSGLLKNDPGTITTGLSGNNDFTTAINPAPNTSGSNEAPKAYLNVLFFDDQFKFDAASSQVIKVNYSPNAKQTIDRSFSNAITAGKSGYVYIYFSNESETTVYFDNFMLTHERSSLIEETHYYPFGLVMAGISSKAAGKLENKFKFNFGSELQSNEFSDGSGLDWYDTDYRRYDAQIGRFHQIDPLSSFAGDQSPYTFVMNNPIKFVDPQGLDTTTTQIKDGKIQIKKNADQGDVVKILDADGNASFYTYDPENEDANSSGYVGSGLESSEQLQEVTVTASKKSEGSSNSSFSWYGTGSQGNWYLGSSASALAELPGSFRITNGIANGSALSPKYYSSGWTGGSRARIKTFNVSSTGKLFGKVSLGIGIVMDGVGVYKYYKSGAQDPNAVHPAKMGLNTGMGVYGLYVNPIAGALYFGVDAFYPGGWRGYADDYERRSTEVQKIMGPNFILAPYGSQKF